MGSRPEELRSEIEQTRDELTYDVDRLADHTVPSRVVGRKWEGVKGRARAAADTVMGARDTAQDKASDAGSKVHEKATQAGDKVQETARSAAGTVRDAPDTVARQTRGNPLAAGVIAFGVGLLAASLLPETKAEKRAGAAVADRSGGLVDKAREAGREIADDLGGTAREAAQQVKETARDAAGHTAEQAKESGRTTVEQTRQSVS
jgi:hypothetical protein